MIIVFLLIIFGVISIDQLLKFWAVEELKSVGSMDFLKIGEFKIMDLTYAENTGAAFSSFQGSKVFLIVLPIALVIFLLVYLYKDSEKNPIFSYSIAAVIGGGIGNLIDRIRLGYVVDYLDLQLFDFAIFNFADIFVVLGSIMILIYVIFIEKKVTKKNG